MSREEMSAEEFRALAKPKPKRKRPRETKDVQETYRGRKKTQCRECDELFHALNLAIQRLRKHRESHKR